MKIKMGLFAENLSAAEQAARQGSRFSPMRTRLYVGKKMVNALGSTLNAADRGMTRVLEPMFRPGGEAWQGAGNVAGEAYTSIAQLPRVLKTLGITAPLGLYYQNQAMEKLTPIFNRAIQEGRTVYANDKEFLERKAALREKTAVGGFWDRGPQNPPNYQLPHGNLVINQLPQPLGKPWALGGAQGFGQGLAAAGDAGRSQLLQGLGALFGGTAGAPNAGAAFGMMAGGAAQGIGDMIGSVGKGVADPTAGTLGYRLNRMLHPVTTRVRADELLATSFFNSLGGEVAKGLVGLLKDMAGKAVSGIAQAPAHASMLDNLMATDPILARADPEELMNVYHTVAKFAPTLATDENAVRSIMRQVATQGTEGIDYATIANIAKAERDITGGGK